MHTWIDYNTQSFCSHCQEVLSKSLLSCPDCGKKLRRNPKKRSKNKSVEIII